MPTLSEEKKKKSREGEISYEEFKSGLNNSFQNNKSPGSDGLPTELNEYFSIF